MNFYLLNEDESYLLQEDGYKIIFDQPYTIDEVGSLKTYRFQSMMFLDAINEILGMAPYNWYWHLGADSIMNFHAKPSSATHKFIVGREVNEIKPHKSMENIKNAVLFWNSIEVDEGDRIFHRYKDATSIGLYDHHYKKIVDSRYQIEASVQTVAESIITSEKDPIVRATLVIVDNNQYEKGYDIDEIQPGDTCKILNLSPTANAFFNDNMTIMEVHYKDDMTRVELIVEAVPRQLASQHAENQRNLQERTEQNIPPFYVEGN